LVIEKSIILIYQRHGITKSLLLLYLNRRHYHASFPPTYISATMKITVQSSKLVKPAYSNGGATGAAGDRATPLYLLLLVFLTCSAPPHRVTAQSQQKMDEAHMLLRIKSVWGDPPVLATWNASAGGAHCQWPYVRCNVAGRVSSLSLAGIDASGPLPDAVCNLSSLTHLNISQNSINDTFPIWFYHCGSLQSLNLSFNNFHGELPDDIGHILPPNLTLLAINQNKFNGTIPTSLSKLQNLRHLDVSDNNITDTFPTSLYHCGSLQSLDLSFNNFHGELPVDIGHNLPLNMTKFSIDGNKFNGTIPTSLMRLRNLLHLGLSSNLFVGTIPAELGELTSLQTLAIGWNLFDAGELPASYSKLTNLEDLYAPNCSLIGPFPSYVVEMRELWYLHFGNNSLTGRIPPGIWRLKKLKVLYLYRNNFADNLLVDGFAAVSLKWLDLSNNNLSGVLPLELGKHSPDLRRFWVNDNKLTGAIPEGLCDGGQLEIFGASNNQLNGSIPPSLANCATLKKLGLRSNQLSGGIP
jgi:kinase